MHCSRGLVQHGTNGSGRRDRVERCAARTPSERKEGEKRGRGKSECNSKVYKHCTYNIIDVGTIRIQYQSPPQYARLKECACIPHSTSCSYTTAHANMNAESLPCTDLQSCDVDYTGSLLLEQVGDEAVLQCVRLGPHIVGVSAARQGQQ